MAGRPKKIIIESNVSRRHPRVLLSEWIYDRYSELEQMGWREGRIDSSLGSIREGALMALTEARQFCYMNRNFNITAADLIAYLVEWVEAPRRVKRSHCDV